MIPYVERFDCCENCESPHPPFVYPFPGGERPVEGLFAPTCGAVPVSARLANSISSFGVFALIYVP